jgi:hypothetical protein
VTLGSGGPNSASLLEVISLGLSIGEHSSEQASWERVRHVGKIVEEAVLTNHTVTYMEQNFRSTSIYFFTLGL